MKVLRVSLADIEGQPHGSHHAATNVTVSARYTGPVTLADGTVIPAAIKSKQLPATGSVSFEVYASNDTAVAAASQGFAVVVTAEGKGLRGERPWRVERTVKLLMNTANPVALGSLAEAVPSTQYDAGLVKTINGVAPDANGNIDAGPPFDSRLGLYNWSRSRDRESLSRVVAAMDGMKEAHVAVLGSSTVAGMGDTGGLGWVVRLRDVIAARGGVLAGTGWVFWGNAIASGDTRVTRSGTGAALVANRLRASLTGVGTWAQFNADRPGTQVDITYLNNGGPFSYSIDGAAPVTVTTSGSQTYGTVTVTGLTNATHTVRVAATSTAPAAVIGVRVTNPAANGLTVTRAGISGSKASDWANGSVVGLPIRDVTALSPQVVVISVGINDATAGATPAAVKTSFLSIVQQLRDAGALPIINVMPHAQPFSITAAQWDAYVSALYEVADTAGVALVDMNYRWGDWNTAEKSGLFGSPSDLAHPGPAGHADHARVMADVLIGA